jgi:hypothetical protein
MQNVGPGLKIPSNMLERKLLYEDLVRECTASRNDRFTFYQMLRNYYLFGAQDSKGAPYNKIASTVETLSSFIYSPDTLKFSLHLGTEASTDEVYKAIPLATEIAEQWRASRTHILFGLGVRWSMVYGLMLMKILWNQSRVRSYLVEPHQFGVLREDIMPLEDQEAFTHHYTMTKSQLFKSLEGNPRRESIMARVGRSDQDTLPPLSTGLSRLLIGSPVGGIPGSVAVPGAMSGFEGGVGRGPTYDYAPHVEVDLIDMCDLYVYDDEARDYQVVTRAAPDITIYDRASHTMGHVQGVCPFNVIRTEENAYDYFWGNAFVARLTWLQDWRTQRIMQIKDLLEKQVDPPMSGTGMVGIADEKFLAFRSAGSRLNMPTPNAKIEIHAPVMPPEIFAEVQQIDAMFDDQAGLGHVLQGKGEAGVRSRGQADLMARLGSARPKERALAIEECCESVAGNILRQVQDHSDQRFQYTVPGEPEPRTFIAEQFTRDYEVQVDGHSSSPIFIEDRKHDAVTLLEAKAISRDRFLKMFDIPDLQVAQAELKVLEKQEAAQRQQELAAGIQPKAGGKKK